jgi:hypothetical protein
MDEAVNAGELHMILSVARKLRKALKTEKDGACARLFRQTAAMLEAHVVRRASATNAGANDNEMLQNSDMP